MTLTLPVIDANVSERPFCKMSQTKASSHDYKHCNDTKCKYFPTATQFFESRDPYTWERGGGTSTPRESFTTALLALYLLHPDGDKTLPFRMVMDNYKCTYAGKSADLSGLTLDQLDIEIPNRSDLVIRAKSGIFHIENKPWTRESGGNEETQLKRYARDAKEEGAIFCVLISCGNPQDVLWQQLRTESLNIILWEEILLRMEEANFCSHLAPSGTLKPYYEAFVY